jgi:sugar lactone lactonase YvrE
MLARPEVAIGGVAASIVASSEEFLIARVPYGAHSGEVTVKTNGHISNGRELKVAQPLAENLHPVANPAIDLEGNIYVTFSGSRGQKVPVSIYKIDSNYNVKPFLSDLMNATGMAIDPAGDLYVSSRYDGTVYKVTPNGTMTTYAEGMGIATGIAFDREGSLYVGDRSGTIWRIAPDRQIFVYATLEPSVAAYHLAFSPDGKLYVSGPTTSSFDAVYTVDHHGTVEAFYRGLGRPQGLAFDAAGNCYVAASLAGRRGIVRITPDKKASLSVSGHSLVGLAFTRTGGAVLATTTSVFHLTWGIQPLSLV